MPVVFSTKANTPTMIITEKGAAPVKGAALQKLAG